MLNVQAPREKRYCSLQLLRALASLFVLVHHATTHLNGGGIQFPVWAGGLAGVDVFFVLSGFVMFYSSQKLLTARHGWRTFMRHRLFRVAPMYWLATLVFFMGMVATPALQLYKTHPIRWLVGSMLFLPVREPGGLIYPVLAVGWTLVFEMLFYVVFAFALLIRKPVLPIVGAALTLLTIASVFRRPTWPAVSFYCDPLVLEFFAGMVLARLCMRGRLLSKPVAIAVASLGLLDLLWFPFYTESLRVIDLGVPAALVVYAFASLEKQLHRIPAWVSFMGDASYVLYLVHVPIIQIVVKLMERSHWIHPWLAFFGSVALSLAVASVLRQWIERPTCEWLRCRFDRPALPVHAAKATTALSGSEIDYARGQ